VVQSIENGEGFTPYGGGFLGPERAVGICTA